MPKVFTSKQQKTGEIGEEVAVSYVTKHGFNLIDRNYTEKAGEIDIICEKTGRLYFFEVKAIKVTHVTLSLARAGISNFRPEENATPAKLRKLYRTVELFLMKHRQYAQMPWQIDLLAVYLNMSDRTAKVTRIENI